MSDTTSVRSSAITSDERIRNVLRRHIRKALDNNEFTRAVLAEDSGVNIHCIDMILTRDAGKHRRIAAEDAFCLAYALGSETVNALAGTIRHTARHVDDVPPLQPMLIAATAMEGLSIIARAAADGRIDHLEEHDCRDAADMIIATVAPLSSTGAL